LCSHITITDEKNITDYDRQVRDKASVDLFSVFYSKGIQAFAMIAPLLSGTDGLIEELSGKVDHVLIDRLNYFYANRIYMENNLEWAKEEPFFIQNAEKLKEGFTAESANPLSPLWCRGQTLIKEALPVMDRAPAKLLFLFSYLCRCLFTWYFFYCCFFYCCLFHSLCGHPITCPSPDRFKNLPSEDSLRLT